MSALIMVLALILGTSIVTVAIGQTVTIWKALHSIKERPEHSGRFLVMAAIGLGMLESLVLYALIVFLMAFGV
jgi:F0F1-type ATP synthase membrane subunit c/vacuolar-type H+-ATPase subunit K